MYKSMVAARSPTRIKSAMSPAGSPGPRDTGNQVVVVISAMGDTTDDLIALAHKITDQPDSREMDMLLSTGEIVSSALLTMALHKMGYKAISLSGRQAGIFTDDSYSKAKILKVESDRIVEELNEGNIVIVAGFQGITDEVRYHYSRPRRLGYYGGSSGHQSESQSLRALYGCRWDLYRRSAFLL